MKKSKILMLLIVIVESVLISLVLSNTIDDPKKVMDLRIFILIVYNPLSFIIFGLFTKIFQNKSIDILLIKLIGFIVITYQYILSDVFVYLFIYSVLFYSGYIIIFIVTQLKRL